MQDSETYGKWIFLVPVEGIQLTLAVKHEFLINRVLLVDSQKIPYIRKRLGINWRISELKKQHSNWNIFSHKGTYAVVRDSGKTDELHTKCLRLVADELALISSSQLGWTKRRFNSHPGLIKIAALEFLETARIKISHTMPVATWGEFSRSGSTQIGLITRSATHSFFLCSKEYNLREAVQYLGVDAWKGRCCLQVGANALMM